MKANFFKISSMIFFLLLIVPGCNKKDDPPPLPPPCACGIENPQENLEWLKYILEHRFYTEIYSIHYQGQEYIGVYDRPKTSDSGCVIYNCEGEQFCQLSSYLWTISSSDYAFSYHSNTNQSYPIETKGALGTFYLYLTTSNACGSQNLSKPITVASGGGGGVPEVAEMPAIIIYPNPATDYINVKILDGIIAEIQENKDLKYEIILYNSNQQIVYKKKSDDSQITINTKHLENGF